MLEGEKLASLGPNDIELGENVPQNVVNTKWRDLPFAIAYYISLGFSLILGIYLMTQVTDNEDEDSLSFKFNILQICAGVASSIVFTLIWLAIVIMFAGCIIKSSLIFTPILLLIGAAFSFMSAPVVGVMLIFMAAMAAWYAYAVWKRVQFAVACLKIVISVFKSFYAPLFVNLFMSIISIILLVIDFMVFVGVTNGLSSSGLQVFIMFIIFFLIYWHNIVSINVAHFTACGVMGTWFYSDSVEGVTKNSFRRAVTTSFGSICFGALIEAVIRALSAIVRYLQQQNRDNIAIYILLCILRCILNCIGDIVEYINSYTYVFVALYGETYLQSAKNVWNMFKSRGIEALINDDLTTIPLWLGAVLNLIVIILICVVSGDFNGNVFIAIIIGSTVYLCCVYTLISYTKTLFVCWINDPYTFSVHRPDQYNQIFEAANKFGYNTQFCQQSHNQQM